MICTKVYFICIFRHNIGKKTFKDQLECQYTESMITLACKEEGKGSRPGEDGPKTTSTLQIVYMKTFEVKK